jgi:hypothetical protein
MITIAVENIPEIRDGARDIPFFRITARLCTPSSASAPSVLLASYDDGPADTVQLTPAQHESSTTAPAGANEHT